MGKDTVKLRVLPNIQLPHQALLSTGPGKPKKVHVFDPDCEVEETIAQVLLKTQSNVYVEAKGEPDIKKYTYRADFKDLKFTETLKGLSNPGKQAVYNYTVAVAKAEASGDPLPGFGQRIPLGGATGDETPRVPKILEGLTASKLEKMNLDELGKVFDAIEEDKQPDIPDGSAKAVIVEALVKALKL